MERLYMGIEIGATKQQVVLGTAEGKLLCAVNEKVPWCRGAADILDWLKARVPELLSKSREYGGDVRNITVGFGGPLESATGRILSSIQVPGWENFRLRHWLEENFHLPSAVINDTVAGGFAELYLGRGRRANNLFYTNIGSGIGGAFFLNRAYYDGIGFGAGYLGNSYIPDWNGGVAKLESICSGFGIESRLREEGYVPQNSLIMELCGGEPGKVTCRMLEEACGQGDPFAREEVDRIARSFSIGLCNVLALMGAELIVVGGGVAKMGELLFDPIRRFTDELAFIANRGHYEIAQSELLDGAVPMGAVLYGAHWDDKGKGY